MASDLVDPSVGARRRAAAGFDRARVKALLTGERAAPLALAAAQIALVALCGWLGGQLVWATVTPQTPLGGAGARSSALAPRAASPSGAARIDPFWGGSAAPAAAPGTWRLHGVMMRAAPLSSGAILSSADAPQMHYAQGATLPDGTVLHSVTAEAVILRGPQGDVRLYVDDDVVYGAGLAAPGGAAGPPQGVLLPGPLPAAVLARYGLEAGDRLLSVNGQTVDTVAALEGLAASLARGGSARAVISRNGTRLEVSLP